MRFTLVLAAVVIATGGPVLASGLDVSVYSRANVVGPVVRIGDVADLSRVRQADAALAQRLAGTALLTLGIGDVGTCIDRRSVHVALRRAAPASQLRVEMTGAADCVQVVPSLQRVDVEQVLSATTGLWVTECSTVAQACVAQGRSDSGSRADAGVPALVPLGALSFEPVIPANLLRLPSRVNVPVRVLVDGHYVGAVQVPIEWHALRPAWRTVAPIAAGQVVRRADVRPVRVDTRDVRDSGVVYDARTRLARATRALAVDEVVVIDAESTIAQFRAGDAVPVVATIGKVRVSRTGTAVQDGRPGSSAFVRFSDGGLLSSPVPRDVPDAAAPSTLGETR